MCGFYIQIVSTPSGNHIGNYWKKLGQGNTPDITEAHVFSEDEVKINGLARKHWLKLVRTDSVDTSISVS